MKTREDHAREHEERRTSTAAAMMAFVRMGQPYWVMKNQYETVGKIVDDVYKLARTDDGKGWRAEFAAGTEISEACRAAWLIQTHTRMPVSFSFNGVEITMAKKGGA